MGDDRRASEWVLFHWVVNIAALRFVHNSFQRDTFDLFLNTAGGANVKCGMPITIRLGAVILTGVFIGTINAMPSEQQLPRKAKKIPWRGAEHIVSSRVLHGRVSAWDLERAHGKLIWSFDIVKPATSEVAEMQVDARTEKVVSIKTESPGGQATEAALDRNQQGHRAGLSFLLRYNYLREGGASQQ